MQLQLSSERKSELQDKLINLYRDDFDESLSSLKADQILEGMLTILGPFIYNQAVEDVRQHFQNKLDELDGEVYLDE